MSDFLRGKVAKILNTRELVINLGSEQGVEPGMYFEVLDPKGENITDPDTNEVLGSIDRPKVAVRVSRVEPRLAVAETFRSKRVNVGGTGQGMADLSGFASLTRHLMPPKWVVKHETLKTDERTWEDVDEEDCFVKTGDPVRQIERPLETGGEQGGVDEAATALESKAESEETD